MFMFIGMEWYIFAVMIDYQHKHFTTSTEQLKAEFNQKERQIRNCFVVFELLFIISACICMYGSTYLFHCSYLAFHTHQASGLFLMMIFSTYAYLRLITTLKQKFNSQY
jgi:hypothetical protein